MKKDLRKKKIGESVSLQLISRLVFEKPTFLGACGGPRSPDTDTDQDQDREVLSAFCEQKLSWRGKQELGGRKADMGLVHWSCCSCCVRSWERLWVDCGWLLLLLLLTEELWEGKLHKGGEKKLWKTEGFSAHQWRIIRLVMEDWLKKEEEETQ